MAYWLSIGHVTDDVTWPWKVKLVASIRLERNISKTARDRDYDIWPMGYEMITWPMTSRDPQRCCEAVRSAILATAWFLVNVFFQNVFTWLRVNSSDVWAIRRWMNFDDTLSRLDRIQYRIVSRDRQTDSIVRARYTQKCKLWAYKVQPNNLAHTIPPPVQKTRKPS